jgi:hypothetical protein
LAQECYECKKYSALSGFAAPDHPLSDTALVLTAAPPQQYSKKEVFFLITMVSTHPVQ